MSRYKMWDGTLVDTSRATQEYEESRHFDGHNQIGDWSGSQWTHATLYRSRRGRYYLVTTSQWQGSEPRCEWVSPEEAARFLLRCVIEVPEELAAAAEAVSE